MQAVIREKNKIVYITLGSEVEPDQFELLSGDVVRDIEQRGLPEHSYFKNLQPSLPEQHVQLDTDGTPFVQYTFEIDEEKRAADDFLKTLGPKADPIERDLYIAQCLIKIAEGDTSFLPELKTLVDGYIKTYG